MHALMHGCSDERECLGVRALPDASSTRIKRRRRAAPALALGLLIAVGGVRARRRAPRHARRRRRGGGPLAPNAFVRIGTDNIVTVICKHHEMGQGNTTGLATMVAEELDADWCAGAHRVRAVGREALQQPRVRRRCRAPAARRRSPTRTADAQAGATARAMLVAAAAEAWKVPADARSPSSKSVLDATRRASARATARWPTRRAGRRCRPNAKLKDPKQFTLIGKDGATPRVDSESKTNGTALYTIDVKLPGLLTAVVALAAAVRREAGVVRRGRGEAGQGRDRRRAGPEGVAVRRDRHLGGAAGPRRAEGGVGRGGERASSIGSAAAGAVPHAGRRSRDAVRTRPAMPSGRRAGREDDRGGLRVPVPRPRRDGADELRRRWMHDGMLETWTGHQFQTFDHMLARQGRRSADRSKVKLNTLVSGGSFGRRANAYSRLHGRGGPHRQGDRRPRAGAAAIHARGRHARAACTGR